jgi:colanic acid/amylovoran biosynthesis protein
MDVVFIPHVFRTRPDGTLIHGPDSAVTRQVCSVLRKRHPALAERVSMVEGCHEAQLTKAIIGTCDLYLSGRLHAGVAALSQGIPTVLLPYGRKFLGFAALVGQQDFAARTFRGRIDGQDVKVKLDRAWENRDAIRARINATMVDVRQLSRLNGRIVADLLGLVSQSVRGVPVETVDEWEGESVKLLSSIGIIGQAERANDD